MNTPVDMKNNKIKNLANPTDSNDAVNNSTLDSTASTLLPKAGGRITGRITGAEGTNGISIQPGGRLTLHDHLVLGSNKVFGINSGNGASWFDGNRLKLVEPRNANNQQIYMLGNPLSGDHAAPRSYVDNAVNTRLPLAGGTLTGSVDAGGNKITSQLSGRQHGRPSGGGRRREQSLHRQRPFRQNRRLHTLTGNLDMGTHKITALGDPTSPP